YNLISEEFCIFFFHSKTIIFLIPVPLFQLDHQINGLCVLYTFHTEKSLYIYDSNTSQFNKMPGDIRSGTYQRYIADTTYLHNIIADKTMSSLNQFQSGLTLSDAALAHDQHAFTVYIHQNAMDGNTRCKLHTKPADNFSHESRSSISGHQDRHIIFMGQIQHILIRFCHG